MFPLHRLARVYTGIIKSSQVLDESDLTQLEALLDEPDPDIWDWVVG
ncbi:MAG TPA: succinate dehydrogenase assembly factor 2, partial [Alphaproteobacteria bacterium]|nr:succinate dehydrogenase assembly factor 2 [Alphaproteobacteria bacterium]